MRIIHEDPEVRIVRLTVGPFGTNVYILMDLLQKEAILIDAADDATGILKALQGFDLKIILQTHCHIDHIMALGELRRITDARLGVHPDEPGLQGHKVDHYLQDGERVKVGHLDVEVLSTPGHTPGSTSFLFRHAHCFSGDTVFPGGPGKTSSPLDFLKILKSLEEKIYVLPDEVILHPGHGEEISVGRSREEYRIFRSKPRKKVPFGEVLWLTS